jgi:hypothetical protein
MQARFRPVQDLHDQAVHEAITVDFVLVLHGPSEFRSSEHFCDPVYAAGADVARVLLPARGGRDQLGRRGVAFEVD